jgi:hypothetical protein
MSGVSIQLCLITTTAGVTKERAETIRRKFYRLMNDLSWLTPIGWVMDWQTCNEIMGRLQEIADEFFRESKGKQLFYLTTVMMSYDEVKRLLQFAKEPENLQIKMRLKKILDLQKQLVELTL